MKWALYLATVGVGGVFVVWMKWFVYRLTGWTPGKRFDSNGTPIYFTDEGQGEAVILIHGLGVTGNINWRFPCVTRTLTRRYRVITMDARGHGHSGRPEDIGQYGIKMVEDVVRLMDHLGVEKAHVAGYSMGGFISLKLLLEHPERLLSVAVCAAGWEQADEDNLGFLEETAQSIESGNGIEPLIRRLEPDGREPFRLQIALVNAIVLWVCKRQPLLGIFRGFTEFALPEDQLRANQVPAMTMVGGRDPLSESAARLEGVLANHESVVIPRGDHGTTILSPVFTQRLLDFFGRHGSEQAQQKLQHS